MPAVRGEFNKQLAPGARKASADEYAKLPSMYTAWMNVDTSARAEEEDLISTGLPVAPEKPEGVDVSLDKPVHRGTVKYTHLTYGLGYEVTKELVEDDLYGVVAAPSSRFLSASMREAEEIIGHSVINNAATTQQAYDGVSLLNSAHPVVGGTALANTPTAATDLSVSALQAAVERFKLLKTDRSLRIRMMPAILLVPVENFWLANEILRSEFKPFTANNEVNVLRQMGMTPADSQYITDTDSWYVLAPKGQHRLNFFWRRKPQFDDDFDKKAQIALFMLTARFSAGGSDWRGLDGSIGA